MDPSELLRLFEGRLDDLTGAISDLVEIESPSFDPDGIRDSADWIEGRLLEALPDAAVERIDVEGRGVHLILRLFGDLPGRPALLLGHIDTVHPRGSKERNPTRIEDGRLHGCGTFDMKANVALLIEVLRVIREQDLVPARPVTILLTCDEEVGSETGRPVVEREAGRSEYCLVFEPSAAGKVKTARKGTGGYTLSATGKPAHAGLDPEKGASAILELARQIVRLGQINDPAVGTTVTVGTVKGGTATNVVPEHAACSIDVRFSSVEEANKVETALSALAPVDERVRLELKGEINRYPLERTEDVVRLFDRARSLAAGLGYDLGETSVGGASDGNFVAALGVPILDGLGIKGDGAHRHDEHVLVEDIPFRATLYTLLLTTDLMA